MNKTIALISNDSRWTYCLRLELIKELLNRKYKVIVIVGYGDKVDDLISLGCDFVDVSVDRHSKNPFRELMLVKRYYSILNKIKPDIVLTFTLKPNAYAGRACGKLNIPYIANITGLGTPLENSGIVQKISLFLLKKGLQKADMVFFQNNANRDFLIKYNVVKGRHFVLPGSGVNIDKFQVFSYPNETIIKFCFVGRILEQKGIDVYLEAAKQIKQKYSNVEFHVFGSIESEYKGILQECIDKHIAIYHGSVNDMESVYQAVSCVIHPTFYPEGLSNVLLEASACGRPIITTDRAGCREVIDDGVNGFIVKQKDSRDLVEKIEKFLSLSYEERRQMGLAGRKKVEKEFDRKIVVDAYLNEIKKIEDKQHGAL